MSFEGPLETLKDTTFYLVYFLYWWYVRQTLFWLKFIFRTLLLIIDAFSLIPIIKNLFAPYHGDFTFIGRLMGFVTRFVWFVIASLILIICLGFLLFILPIWWGLPLTFYLGFTLASFYNHWLFSLAGVLVSFLCPFFYWRQYVIQPKKTVDQIDESKLSLQTLSQTFTPGLKRVFSRAYDLADDDQNIDDLSYFLFLALVKEKRNRPIFKRLDVPPKVILERAETKKKELLKGINPLPVLLRVFWAKALEMGHKHLDVDAVLVALVENEEPIKKLFIELEIKKEELDHTAQWVYARILGSKKWKYWQREDFHLYGGTDRAWTSGWIPTLKHFSQDITAMAARGVCPYTVGRKKEIEEVVRILSRTTKNNVILLGPAGVGKTSIVYGIAQRILKGDIPELKGKRLVSLDLSALIAGTSGRGDFEARLNAILSEVRPGETILFIDEIQNLMGAGSVGKSLLDASSILEPILSSGTIQCIGATTHNDFRQLIEPKENFATLFQTIEIIEPSDDEAIRILEGLTGLIESRQKVAVTFQAIEGAVKLSREFVRDRVLPEKAIDVLDEAAVAARKTKDKKVTGELVAQMISEKTGIPLAKLTVQESDKLLNLEKEFHQRIINQEEAIVAISNAMRRARAGLKDSKKPIASFLFLGPTGVGKTETTKALSEIYYGSEENMIRIDMSEYQDPSSIYRLIGSPNAAAGAKTGGQLTDAVRSRPFSLILLDEFEKANPEILNLFLQVFDDGRLTDSVGRTVVFYDAIIIATSNAQSVLIQEAVKSGVSPEQLQKIVMDDLNKHFRPELINRFDAIITFKPLNMDQVIEITHLLLGKVRGKLAQKEIEFEVSPKAIIKLAKLGFDPQFGARPLRRIIQEKIENPLAEKILKGEVKRGQKAVINENDI